ADQAEQIESMLRHLGKLKEEYRRVLTYAFFDQLKTAEIAESMGISRPAASMMLLRAVRALRSSMTETAAPAQAGGSGDREPAHA
ncbi:MAG: sigma-70 family RNA polymerase sigma factor, partial [Phycisphaerales bacterium]